MPISKSESLGSVRFDSRCLDLRTADKLHRSSAERVEETGGLPRPHRRLRDGRLRVQAVGHLPQDLRHVLWLEEVIIYIYGSKEL